MSTKRAAHLKPKRPAPRKLARTKAAPKLVLPDSYRYLGRFVVGFVP